MAVIRMKGIKIKNLDQLREHFDFINAKDYLFQGTLSAWMREQGETELAEELEELKELNYSDQTLMDNFSGIFGVELQNFNPETTEIIVAENSNSTTAATNEIIIGRGSFAPITCFGKKTSVIVDEDLVSYGVNGDSPSGVHRFMKNKLALLIVQKISSSLLPSDIVENHNCQWKLEKDRELHNYGWQKEDYEELGDRITDWFASKYKLYPHAGTGACLLLRSDGSLAAGLKTLGNILDFVGDDDVVLNGYAYNSDLAKSLLTDEFENIYWDRI